MVGLPETRAGRRRPIWDLRRRLSQVTKAAPSARKIRDTLALLFGRRWWWKTLLVILAMGVMTSLGFWQLDRLDQRRAYNQQRQAALAAPPIDLSVTPLPQGEIRDRQATAQGEFDYARQVAIRNQSYAGQPGYHLVTPLLIAGSDKAVLVNRGWIPVGEADPAHWRGLDEQHTGPHYGILQPTRRRPDGTVSAVPQDTVTGWYRLDIEAIGQTLPYPLLPVVLQLTPGNGKPLDVDRPRAAGYSETLPHRIEPDISFSEGNHLSYALQWFGFAITAAVVYISVARRAEFGKT
ncbi:MAG: SURF1 family protein [Caldilineaceae bacterium SB0668_bin_21]|nr:SURF1 family protein [Caldilineaceae bacterium SB0668_bin_21]MYC20629.1 SURF1 family protein [Caldilineaceae bacterium SB0662_bin_25]